MAHEKDLEAHLPHLQQISTRSTMDEALDAEANFSPPEVVGAEDREKDSDPGPPPNGGYYAWLQVAGSFFLFFNSW